MKTYILRDYSEELAPPFSRLRKRSRKKIKIYRNNLKNREFDKEVTQFFASGASDRCLWQGASEDQKNAAKPTSSKTDSSGCFGIYLDGDQKLVFE